MGRKNGGFWPEEQNGASTSVSDALISTTMSLIGFPVDVHVRDGSIYSGTFHTASIEDAYGIVLKKARMIKKGNRQTNLPDGRLIETLIILSEDLVQVVAKELLLPAKCISGKVGAANVKATAGTSPQNICEEKEATVTNSKEPNLDREHDIHAGFTSPYENNYPNESVHNNSVPIANGKSDCRNVDKGGEAFTVSSNMRQGGDSSEEKQSGLGQEQDLRGKQTTDEVEGSRSCLDGHSEDMNAGTNKEESLNFMSFERSAVAKLDDPNFSLSLSSASLQVVLPKITNHGQTAKVVGHVGSRTQPVRYASQDNHLQAGTASVHQNSQNMTGRVGQLFYAHPVSNGAAGYSQLSSHPLLIPYQANLPKHQGMAAMQAVQLCVTPPYLANGQQQFAVPSYIPISLPFYPIMGSIPVPGSDGFLGTKLV